MGCLGCEHGLRQPEMGEMVSGCLSYGRGGLPLLVVGGETPDLAKNKEWMGKLKRWRITSVLLFGERQPAQQD